MKRALLFALWLAAAAHAADDPFARDYPPGSIANRAQAQAALAAAGARAGAIEQDYKRASERCAKAVLVTGCRTDARRRRDAQMREVERVRVEARDLTRRLDAQERANRRAAEEARRAAEASAKAEQAARARAVYEARSGDAGKPPPQPPAPRAPKTPPAVHELTPEQRAQNVKRLQDKQRAAAEYAQRKAKEREDNARQREQRRLQREADAKKRAAAVPQ